MIINISRAKQAHTCWKKVQNLYIRNLAGPRTMSLVDGTAFHKGAAEGLASGDWNKATEAAQAQFNIEAAASTVSPEQLYLLEDHFQLVKAMLSLYETHYKDEDYQILQPECEFDIPLTTTEHRFVGRTDALIRWNSNVWLMDHKTSAIKGDQFWDEFELDIQQTGYIYGIWKATGLRPRGFVINHIYRPSEAQVSNWNSKRRNGPPKNELDYLGYERRAFLRTEEDLARFESMIIDLCDEWEWRVRHDKFPMEPSRGACLSYNRRCDYLGACKAHDAPSELAALASREKDYVDVKTERLVNIGTTN